MTRNLIRDIDSPESHAIFKEIQDKYGITDGGTEPYWTYRLSMKLEEKGMTKEELKREVEEYYRTWNFYRD